MIPLDVPTTALQIQAIEKTLGYARILDGVSFDVARGEMVAILGSNGAGKTTLLRVLATILRASGGEAFIHGKSLTNERDATRALTGYLGHGSGLYDGLTVEGNLALAARLHGLSDMKGRIERALELARLEDRRHSQVRHLSKGLTRRLAVERALMHDPPLLLMDEPFDGLDPVSHERLEQRLRQHREQGGTVLVVTHDLDLAGRLCGRAIVLRRGRLHHDVAAAGAPVPVELLA